MGELFLRTVYEVQYCVDFIMPKRMPDPVYEITLESAVYDFVLDFTFFYPYCPSRKPSPVPSYLPSSLPLRLCRLTSVPPSRVVVYPDSCIFTRIDSISVATLKRNQKGGGKQ